MSCHISDMGPSNQAMWGWTNLQSSGLGTQEEKPASIACKIEAVSNLKFLKLLPGPVSGGWISGSGRVGWVSGIIVLLLPVELFFAFHTEIANRMKTKLVSCIQRLHKIKNYGNRERLPLRGISSFGAISGWWTEIHDFSALHEDIDPFKLWW